MVMASTTAIFGEIKQGIGSAYTQTRNPDAVVNHLHFCMVATAITWIYAAHAEQAPGRRYASDHTTEYAFADVRRALVSGSANLRINGEQGGDSPP